MEISDSNPSAWPTTGNTGTAAQDITAADVLELESFRGLSGEQAENLAAALKTFTQVVFMACTGRKTA
jgi:hypothetical protein